MKVLLDKAVQNNTKLQYLKSKMNSVAKYISNKFRGDLLISLVGPRCPQSKPKFPGGSIRGHNCTKKHDHKRHERRTVLWDLASHRRIIKRIWRAVEVDLI